MSETVSQLMEIAGIASRQAAENILKICDNNLERAINYHLENEDVDVVEIPDDDVDTASTASEHASVPGFNNGEGEDDVRAPIPAKREQLLMPEDDNFRMAAVGGARKRRPLFTVCPLRNFAREAELQEQQLMGGNPDEISTGEEPRLPFRPSSSRIAHRPSIRGVSRLEKRKRLEDLFRPPIDLLFCGTFQAARNHASAQNRWLIVNLQDQKEFKSQILNRDIWTEEELKKVVLKHFILWQVSVENTEGLRFKTFYHCKQVPYVCILDPRTGEEKLICDPTTPKAFRLELVDFLNINSYTLEPDNAAIDPNLPEPSTSSSYPKKRRPSATATSSNCNSNSNTPKKRSASDLSEEDQLALAIQNSLKESQAAKKRKSNVRYDSSDDDDDNELVEFSDNSNSCADAQGYFAKAKAKIEEQETFTNFLGSTDDPITKLQLRLPLEDQQRVQLEWPSSTKLRAIRLYVKEKYPDLVKVPYKLITAFPRKDILELDENMTLKDANLHPTALLHLHLDD